MTPEEARREALIKLGGIESTKEARRDQRGLPVLETVWQDIRYGARKLRKNPRFTIVAVLTLTLGIGATPNLIGKSIHLDSESDLVTGVLRPQALATEPRADFLIPWGWQRDYGANNFRVIARLKSGITPEQARAELAALKQRMHPWFAVRPSPERIFPNEDAIGKYVQFDPDRTFEIVGMVGDIKLTGLLEDRPDKMYIPHTSGNGSLIVRTRAAPESLAAPIRKTILEVDADQPVSNVRTLEQDVSRSVAARRHIFTLLGLFAMAAVGLAALGLYGVLAHAVVLRRHEIGIRMTLGAERNIVVRRVLRDGVRLTLIDLAVGLAGVFALSRFLRNQLYEGNPTGPVTFAAISATLLLVALAASWGAPRIAPRADRGAERR